jgi:hypothetical protein
MHQDLSTSLRKKSLNLGITFRSCFYFIQLARIMTVNQKGVFFFYQPMQIVNGLNGLSVVNIVARDNKLIIILGLSESLKRISV